METKIPGYGDDLRGGQNSARDSSSPTTTPLVLMLGLPTLPHTARKNMSSQPACLGDAHALESWEAAEAKAAQERRAERVGKCVKQPPAGLAGQEPEGEGKIQQTLHRAFPAKQSTPSGQSGSKSENWPRMTRRCAGRVRRRRRSSKLGERETGFKGNSFQHDFDGLPLLPRSHVTISRAPTRLLRSREQWRRGGDRGRTCL